MAKVGQKVGDWILRRHIDSGGQGQVFAASRQEGDEEVAIKIIKAVRPKKRSRFMQEVAIHSSLSSQKTENIIPVLDHNLDALENGDVRGFVVMPLAQTTLEAERDLLVGRIELCLEIFIGITNGIKHAHAAGIIHRDIKPGNVLFLDRTLRTPLISDFGICLLKDTPAENRLTELGESVGAKFFMAPEQERGGVADIDPSADLYALGKLLHHIITGRFLYREELEKAFTDSELKSDSRIAQIYDEILVKTIVTEPKARIQSPQILQDAASAILGRTKPNSDNGRTGGRAENNSTPPPAALINNQEQEYLSYNQRLVKGDIESVKLVFDGIRGEFQNNWAPIHESIKTTPREAKNAAEKLISAEWKTTAFFLAIARCDTEQLFRPVKQFLEYVTKTSEGQSGYPAVFTVPHVYAGFLYMATSLVAFHHESWKIFNRLLTEKFEWYYQSGRPLFSCGFALSYFFHPEALQRSASQTHDFYREHLGVNPIIRTLGLQGESLLEKYVQLQFLMSLRGAQHLEKGDDAPLWPDFGRFHGYRLLPLIDRMYNDNEYGTQILKAFGESKEHFFGKLNNRLALLRGRFRGDRYFWDSLDSWEPR